jgi:hypothetical protein
VGEVVGCDEVASAELGGVHVEAAGEMVHDPFDGVCRLRATRPPERSQCRGVGEHPQYLHVDAGDPVAAGGHQLGAAEAQPLVHRSRPQLSDGADRQAHDLACIGGADGDGGVVASCVTGCEQVLAAGFDPLDGAAQRQCRRCDQRVLAVHEAALGAETASHVGHDDPHLGRVQVEGGGDQVPESERHLVAAVHEEAVVLGDGEDGAPLEHAGGHAVVVDGVGHHHVGAFEDITVGFDPGPVHHVGAHLLVHQRRILGHRPAGVGGGRPFVVVDEDVTGGVGGEVAVGGEHGRHRLALVADPPVGERRQAGQLGDHVGPGDVRHVVVGEDGHPVGQCRHVDSGDDTVGDR